MPLFLTLRRASLFALLMATSLAQLATGLLVAGIVGDLFRRLLAGESYDTRQVSWLAGGVLITALAEFGRRVLTERLGLDYAKSVRLALLERMLRRPFLGPRPRSKGSQLLPFVGDLTALRQWWADGVARGSSAALIALGLLTHFLVSTPLLGIWMVILCGASLGLMALVARPMARATSRQRKHRGTMTAIISDRVSAAHTIMGLGGLRRELNATTRRIDRMNRASVRRAQWSGVMRGLVAALPFGSVLILLHLAQGHGPAAPIAAHEIAGLLTLTGMLATAIADIGRAIELAIPARISGRRLHDRIEEIEPLEAGLRLDPLPRGTIARLQDLAMTPEARGFTATIRKGDIIALDAEVGTDPERFLATVGGLQPSVRGSLQVGPFEAHQLGQRQRREWLGIATSWSPLVQGNLHDNLMFRTRGNGCAADLPAMMHALGIGHLLRSDGTPARLRLREEGCTLPPHHIAAIKILRALLNRPRLIIIGRILSDLLPEQIEGLNHCLRQTRGAAIILADPQFPQLDANRRWTLGPNGLSERSGQSGAAVLPHPAMTKG